LKANTNVAFSQYKKESARNFDEYIGLDEKNATNSAERISSLQKMVLINYNVTSTQRVSHRLGKWF